MPTPSSAEKTVQCKSRVILYLLSPFPYNVPSSKTAASKTLNGRWHEYECYAESGLPLNGTNPQYLRLLTRAYRGFNCPLNAVYNIE